MIKGKDEYIICAAIHYDDGLKRVHQPKNITKGIVICGRRHHNCVVVLKEIFVDNICKTKCTSGFLTSYDRFLNREDSYKLFKKDDKDSGEALTSEDLY